MSREKRSIKGEVEAWSREPNKFPNDRGSLGIKVEGTFYNIIGKLDKILDLRDSIPKGCFVQFVVVKNKKGFWDMEDLSTFKVITKSECLKDREEEKVIPIPMKDIGEQSKLPKKEFVKHRQPMSPEEQQHIRLLSSFDKAANLVAEFYTLKDGEDLTDARKKVILLTEKLYKDLNQLINLLKDSGDLK